MVLMVASTALAVGGAIYSANAAKQQADYDASVAERNAESADIKAETLVAENARREIDFIEDYTDFAKQQEVLRRKSGVEAETGTSMLVAMKSAQEADKEIQHRRYNAEQGRRDTKDQAAGFRAHAVNVRIGGEARRTAGYIQAGTSLMSGASRIEKYANS
tara:strand:+ start:773 stop:1255 length:483 start_codon:yes stop_codon:yes gene_type:complete